MSSKKKYKIKYIDNIINATKFLAGRMFEYLKRNPN